MKRNAIAGGAVGVLVAAFVLAAVAAFGVLDVRSASGTGELSPATSLEPSASPDATAPPTLDTGASARPANTSEPSSSPGIPGVQPSASPEVGDDHGGDRLRTDNSGPGSGDDDNSGSGSDNSGPGSDNSGPGSSNSGRGGDDD